MRNIEYMKSFTFPVVIEKDRDGFYVECPALEGCSSQGATYEEAVQNIKEAIQLYLEHLEVSHKEIPKPTLVDLLTVEVTV
jgi:predicted RNase H-like HicB family nuclease